MVGFFSRLSGGKNVHRRTQSAFDEREILPQNSAVAAAVASTASAPTHGHEVAVEFKPVEHPIEPLDNDRPIQSPLSEPSILNDGRIWKERISASIQRRADMPMPESEVTSAKPRPSQSNRVILPSVSAPEHHLLKLLEESGI